MKHVSVFLWQGLPASVKVRLSTRPQDFFPGLQQPNNQRGSITVTGREQGAADAAKLDATRRGGR